MNSMKDDLDIVKELPLDLKSLDIEATGSLVCHSFLCLTLPVWFKFYQSLEQLC